MDIQMVFEDKDFRNFLLEKCRNPIVENFWRKQAQEANGDASLRNMAPYITSKLNQFTTMHYFGLSSANKSTINFREIIDSGKIFLVNLSKDLSEVRHTIAGDAYHRQNLYRCNEQGLQQGWSTEGPCSYMWMNFRSLRQIRLPIFFRGKEIRSISHTRKSEFSSAFNK